MSFLAIFAVVWETVSTLAASPASVGATLVSVLIAAVLRGFTGFGFSMAAVPLLGFAMAPSQAVPIAICLQFMGGLIDLRYASKDCHTPSLRWLIAGAIVGSPLGALGLSVVSPSVARVLIAAIIAAAVLLLNTGFSLAAVPSRAATAVVGLFSGLFNGLAAMPGPPAIVYYMSGPFGRVTARASLLVFFLATSIAAMASVFTVGLLDLRAIVLSVVMLPVMLAGTWIGEHAFRRGSDGLHRRVSVASLGLIAAGIAVKGLSELL